MINDQMLKSKIRYYENAHIVFWLFKDFAWLMEYKFLGLCMIIPTILVALYLLMKSWKQIEFSSNLAVLFWIAANSTWMLAEFYGHWDKRYAILFFGLGVMSFLVYVFYAYQHKNTNGYL